MAGILQQRSLFRLVLSLSDVHLRFLRAPRGPVAHCLLALSITVPQPEGTAVYLSTTRRRTPWFVEISFQFLQANTKEHRG